MAPLTIIESFKSINPYPIPMRTLLETAERRGLSLAPDTEVWPDLFESRAYRLAKADLLLWLSLAPNISQGGQSFSFTDEQRKDFKRQAYDIYAVLEPESNAGCVTFGYKGDRL